jgi:AcrR family transcriptional regulator
VSSDPSAEGVRRIRDEHAAVTRTAILRAARELLAHRSYPSVTVKELAARAGVSIKTIYDTFGSKRGVVVALADLVHTEAGLGELIGRAAAEQDGRRVMALVALINRQIRERCRDIVQTVRSGAAADPDLAAALDEGKRRRHFGQSQLIDKLHTSGQLHPGLSASRAADIVAAITTDEICDVLVDQRGWTFDDYERWLSDTLAHLLLVSGS